MVIESAGISAAAALAGLSAIHIYWAVGGRRGRAAAVPTVDERPLFSPSPPATVVVATLLAASAALLAGGALGWSPRIAFRVGSGGVGVVLLARAVGERRYIGFWKRERGTEFARRDTWLYSPLCLGLGSAAMMMALAS